MKILKIDNETYKVFGDSLQIEDKLEPGVYTVVFSKMQGYFLKKHTPLKVTEKLYGKHEEKVSKLLASYDKFTRPMGVIFSGDKGIGKSIAARMLCEKSVDKGLPVILVEENTPDIAGFIDSIQQECVVLFDEFEKKFKKRNDGDDGDGGNDQDALLSLFDGTSSQIKRMYLITCNDLWQLSDFLVNRPGRFHYHIRWSYPTADEIEAYLKDKVEEQYHGEIEKVVAFSYREKLNFDCLRAIAFELNLGTTFEEAIEDLNIKNTDNSRYDVFVKMKSGEVLKGHDETIDTFSNSKTSVYVSGDGRSGRIWFVPAKMKFTGRKLFINEKETILRIDDVYDDNGDRVNIASQIAEAWIVAVDNSKRYSYNLNETEGWAA